MRIWALTAAAFLAFGAVATVAQTPAPEKPVGEKEAIGKRPVVQGLDFPIYVKDNDGNLVLVPGKTLEDLAKAWEARPADGVGPPAYIFDRLQIRGKLEGAAAVCEITLSIRVREPGWVRVPVRMEQAVLRQAPAHTGPGEGFLAPATETAGYVAWLRGADDKPHVLTLSVGLPVTNVGDESRLPLNLARATESSLVLETRHAALEAELRGGEGIVSAAVKGNASECQVQGASGDMQLVLRASQNKMTAAAAATLESTGTITIKVESQTRVSADARLRVRSLGKPLDAFRVRLPQGMEYVQGAMAGYSVTVVDAGGMGTANAPPTPGAQVVEVKLDRPSTGVVDVRLQAVLLSGEDRKLLTKFEPGRFEVLGAVKQRGTLDLLVDGDWALKWTEDGTTRRVDLTSEPVLAARVAAQFEYVRQPCGLNLQISPQATRINVEPTYIVHVNKDALRMEASLKYRLRGAKASSVAIDLGNWKLARVGPDNLVEAAPPVEGAPRVLQFVGGQTSGDIEIQLEAWQELPDAAESVRFRLPRPQADLLAPALVVIAPADNVALAPVAAETRGLTAETTLPATLKLPSRQQPPLVFRDLAASEPATFSATLQLRERRVAAGRRVKLHFSLDSVEVMTQLHYRVSYVAQNTFRFELPAVGMRVDPQVSYAGQSLPLVGVEPEAGSPTSVYQFSTPAELLGPCEFTVKYALPLPKFAGQETHEIAVPLPRGLADDELTGLGPELSVTYTDPLTVDLADDASGNQVAPVERTGPRELQLAIDSEVQIVHWDVGRVDRPRTGALAVRKTWQQTWLTSDQRRDRAALRLFATESPIRVQLPPGAGASELSVAVNGEEVTDVVVDESNLAAIAVPESQLGKEFTLELWYGFPQGRGEGTHQLAGVSVPTVKGSGEVLWEVLLPEREHLLLDPAGYTPQMQWVWQGFWWRRHSARTQSELEAWSGASPQDDLPASGGRYLFNSFGQAQRLPLVTLERRWLLLMASGIALSLGLALIHFPRARHPAWLLVGSVALVALSLAAPESAVLVAQAAALGVVCVLATYLWKGARASQPQVVLEMRSHRSAEPRRKETAVPRPSESSQPTTLPMGIAAPEPRP